MSSLGRQGLRFDRTRGAVRQIRMLLVKIGLKDDEADAFIDRIGAEFASGELSDRANLERLITERLDEILENQRRAPGRFETIISSIAAGIITDLLVRLYEGKFEGADKVPAPQPSSNPSEIIFVEWPDEVSRIKWNSSDKVSNIPPIALRCIARQSRPDASTVVYLDALGMCWDITGDHRKAEEYRRRAVTMSRKINGANHERTGAALCNLTRTLLLRRKFRECDAVIEESLAIMNRNLACIKANGYKSPSSSIVLNNYGAMVSGIRSYLKESNSLSLMEQVPIFKVAMQLQGSLQFQIEKMATAGVAGKIIYVYCVLLRDIASTLKRSTIPAIK